MRKLIFFSLLLLQSMVSQAQVKFGLGLGMSTTEVAPSDLIITDNTGAQNLLMKLESANYGIHGGVALRIPIKKFFLQPEVYINANSVDFRVQDVGGGTFQEKVFREQYQYLDIPFIMGYKLGPLRLQVGPVGHVFLGCQSELDDIEGYEKVFNDLTFGWQGGLGLDIWKIWLELNYEGNFSRFGDHINLFGKNFAFDERPSRFVATVGFFF